MSPRSLRMRSAMRGCVENKLSRLRPPESGLTMNRLAVAGST